jgi:small multidrug resistance pump
MRPWQVCLVEPFFREFRVVRVVTNNRIDSGIFLRRWSSSATFGNVPRLKRQKKMPAYLYLGIAIVCEVIATSAMRASNGFTRLGPSVIVVIGYGCAFYLLSLTLRTVPVGVAYAIWSGLGIVLVSLAAYVVYHQVLDFAALAGMALILSGVVVMNVFSKAAVH